MKVKKKVKISWDRVSIGFLVHIFSSLPFKKNILLIFLDTIRYQKTESPKLNLCDTMYILECQHVKLICEMQLF